MISATIRDIAIIIVAIETVIINALLVVLIWQVWRLVKMIQTEIKPVIRDGQETVGTVKGTADFVSSSVVSPMLAASSKFAAFRRSVQVMQEEIRGTMAQAVPPRPRRNPSPPDNSNGSATE